MRDALGLSTAQLGLLLLCMSAARSIAGLPLSGPIVHRFGTGFARCSAGAVTLGVGPAGSRRWASRAARSPPAAAGLVLVGLGIGVWDVAMNVEGADVERRLGRSLMPRLHAAFSLGTVAGAGIGAADGGRGDPARRAGRSAIAVLLAGAHGLVDPALPAAHRAPRPSRRRTGLGVLPAWREPRTLLVGLLVLAFAFTEGSANDWIAVALVDGHGPSETVGAIAFGLFVAAMTVGRLVGGALLERFGRVRGAARDGRAARWPGCCWCCWAAPRRSRWSGPCSGAWARRWASRSG